MKKSPKSELKWRSYGLQKYEEELNPGKRKGREYSWNILGTGAFLWKGDQFVILRVQSAYLKIFFGGGLSERVEGLKVNKRFLRGFCARLCVALWVTRGPVDRGATAAREALISDIYSGSVKEPAKSEFKSISRPTIDNSDLIHGIDNSDIIHGINNVSCNIAECIKLTESVFQD